MSNIIKRTSILLFLIILSSTFNSCQNSSDLNTLPNGQITSLNVIPNEGKTVSRSYSLEGSNLMFTLRIGHADNKLGCGYDCANLTSDEFKIKYSVTFYDKNRNILFENTLESDAPESNMQISKPGALKIDCTVEQAEKIAFVKLDYEEHKKQ